MNTVMNKKSVDFIFCAALLLLSLFSTYMIVVSKKTMLIGMPFIATHFMFIGLAKFQIGPLGKRLAKKHISYELLIIGSILTFLGALLHYKTF